MWSSWDRPTTTALAPWETQLTNTLAEMVQEHVDDEGWSTFGDIEVSLSRNEELGTGMFNVTSSVDPERGSAPPPVQLAVDAGGAGRRPRAGGGGRRGRAGARVRRVQRLRRVRRRPGRLRPRPGRLRPPTRATAAATRVTARPTPATASPTRGTAAPATATTATGQPGGGGYGQPGGYGDQYERGDQYPGANGYQQANGYAPPATVPPPAYQQQQRLRHLLTVDGSQQWLELHVAAT